jgi:enamine deaminase RidA (YjgF/YER057c/UK114 family)
MALNPINPESLGAPRGYANGILADPGDKLLFVAGQIGWNEHQALVSNDFAAQFDQALANVMTVVAAAGGSAENVARLVIYVTNKNEYQGHLREVGERYRARMGKHFPAMVLVEVKSLLDDAAKVEIEAIAVIPV